MKSKILVRPDAEADIKNAHLWYEKQSKGLGADFLLCLEEGFARIQRNPEMYPMVHKNVRRLLIRRFPYGIFSIVDPGLIIGQCSTVIVIQRAGARAFEKASGSATSDAKPPTANRPMVM